VSFIPIDVTGRGAVILGNEVVCDGFVYRFPFRIQTHVHQDHMDRFDSSKGCQHIIMSEATRELLIAEFDAELEYRSNIHAFPLDSRFNIGDLQIELLSSGHMVGAAQVAVQETGGIKIGYSGDFDWPLDKVINVEALVIDSTYGSPNLMRRCSWEDACNHLVELVLKKSKTGSVLIKSHPGTLQRALESLDAVIKIPVLASSRLAAEAAVYRRFGYSIGDIIRVESEEGKLAMEENRYIRLYGKGDRLPSDPQGSAVIILSAFMRHEEDPVLEYSERSYRIAITGHADFNGTLEYVKATGAKYVVTDNSRGGYAVELANSLQERLGIEARPSSQAVSLCWGE